MHFINTFNRNKLSGSTALLLLCRSTSYCPVLHTRVVWYDHVLDIKPHCSEQMNSHDSWGMKDKVSLTLDGHFHFTALLKVSLNFIYLMMFFIMILTSYAIASKKLKLGKHHGRTSGSIHNKGANAD